MDIVIQPTPEAASLIAAHIVANLVHKKPQNWSVSLESKRRDAEAQRHENRQVVRSLTSLRPLRLCTAIWKNSAYPRGFFGGWDITHSLLVGYSLWKFDELFASEPLRPSAFSASSALKSSRPRLVAALPRWVSAFSK
jgi:hypothetical protein